MKIPFWNYIREQRKVLFWALILATINQVFSLLDPQIFRLIIDNYATNPGNYSSGDFARGVGLLLLAFVGVALVSRTAKTFQEYFVSVVTQRVGASMYAKSVGHTFSLPFSVFEDRRSGEVLNKLQKAKIDSQNLIQNFISIVFLSLVGILFVLAYAFTVHWTIGVAYLSLIPIVGVSTFYLSKKIKGAQKAIVIESASLAGSTTETLRNVELVKSLGLEKQEIDRLNNVNEKILDLELAKVRLIRKLGFIQGTIVNAMRALLLFVILWLMFKGIVSVGEFFTLLVYSFFIFGPLASFGTVASQYQEAKASNEQLEEILKIKPEEKPRDAKRIGKIKEISYEGVHFKHGSGDIPSVIGASMKVKDGESVAFVGPSGSGKTTLIKLLVGLYKPSSGKLKLNGVDSKNINYDLLRKKMGFVSQDTQLFAGTIRENLLFVNPLANDKDCFSVLKQAQVDHIVKRGDKGLSSIIGEGGLKLSGGEKQRLAIARALLRKPEILIFDEATSALDSLTEKEITETIKEITSQGSKMITVLVAHRLSTIAHVDKICVLEKGKIVETGTHAELLKKKGLYSAMWREQSGGD
jgi:ATP-binding cassette, subfamily B, bacterial